MACWKYTMNLIIWSLSPNLLTKRNVELTKPSEYKHQLENQFHTAHAFTETQQVVQHRSQSELKTSGFAIQYLDVPSEVSIWLASGLCPQYTVYPVYK